MRMRRKGPAQSSSSPSPAESGGVLWLAALLMAVLLLMVVQYLLFPISTMPGRGLRYLWFPPLILVLFVLAGGRYVQHVYSLINVASGFRYLMAKLFGQNLPRLVVSDGKLMVDVMGEENLVHAIGGPGYVLVMPGNAALVESLDSRVRVLGAGMHYLSTLEYVKDTLSLEERYDQIEKSIATTRDGIPITVKDIRYRYRVDSGGEGGVPRTPENPFPYSNEGVISMVYNRTMGVNGLPDFHGGVKGVVEGVIQDYIRTNLVDHLTAPEQGSEDPRGEIHRQFNSDSVKKRFREKGVELAWIDIGHLELPEKVAGQRVDLWQARWSGNARLMRAQGEAERTKHQERGRAEAQADLLKGIIRMLEESGAKGDALQNRHTLYLAGIAQLLDSWGKTPLPPGEPKRS